MYSLEVHLDDSAHSFNSVHVAGSFNDWSQTANALQYDAVGTRWATRLKLSNVRVGDKLLYKFVVNEQEWVCNDQEATETNELGTQNNVAVITEAMEEPDSTVSSAWVEVGDHQQDEPEEAANEEHEHEHEPAPEPNHVSHKKNYYSWLVSMAGLLESLKWFFKCYLPRADVAAIVADLACQHPDIVHLVHPEHRAGGPHAESHRRGDPVRLAAGGVPSCEIVAGFLAIFLRNRCFAGHFLRLDVVGYMVLCELESEQIDQPGGAEDQVLLHEDHKVDRDPVAEHGQEVRQDRAQLVSAGHREHQRHGKHHEHHEPARDVAVHPRIDDLDDERGRVQVDDIVGHEREPQQNEQELAEPAPRVENEVQQAAKRGRFVGRGPCRFRDGSVADKQSDDCSHGGRDGDREKREEEHFFLAERLGQ
ncbi:hypothetical protein KL920_004574 [Ogataea angusta]|nr:hypothetical protein KL920_004574 [Ogataea angusta]